MFHPKCSSALLTAPAITAGEFSSSNAPYAPGTFDLSGKVDLVLCSYSLSMFNPGWEQAIERAIQDLKPGGHFAFVDFHDTRFRFFRWWMKVNHVRMEAHILPFLGKTLRNRFTGSETRHVWSLALHHVYRQKADGRRKIITHFPNKHWSNCLPEAIALLIAQLISPRFLL